MTALAKRLPTLMPRAIAWAQAREAEIVASGSPLTARGIAIARKVGVKEPERVRVALVESLPMPEDPDLKALAVETGLLAPSMIGFTLGHGIYLCQGHDSWRLLAHELRHVFQYEQAGSIAAFLPRYLGEVVQHGYFACPLEADARAHEHAAG